MAAEIVYRHKRAGQHAVDVDGAVEMIDLVLQDSGVPAGGFDHLLLAVTPEAFDADAMRAGHYGGEAGHAQAAFEKLDRIAMERDYGIDDDRKRNREAFALGEGLRVHAFQQIFAIFQYRESQWQSDLRSCQTDARRVAHGGAHEFDELLQGVRLYLLG